MILGAVAIAQIKHSNGKLYGLRLAAAEALIFPLLSLTVLVFSTIKSLGVTLAFAVGCFFAGRAAWRAVIGKPTAPVSVAEKKSNARRFLGLRFWLWPLVCALLIVCLLYTSRCV